MHFFSSNAKAREHAFDKSKSHAFDKENRSGDICERNLEFDEDGNLIDG